MKKKMITFFAMILVIAMIPIQTFAAIQPRIDFYVSMDIVAYEGSGGLTSFQENGYFGHAFIVVHNDSDVPVTIGKISVEPGSFITIGNFGNRSTDYGLWYNIEAYTLQSESHNLYSLSCALEPSDIETINSVINSSDYYSFTTHNCINFACDVWNSVNDRRLTANVLGYRWAEVLIENMESYGAVGGYSLLAKPIGSIAHHTYSGAVYDSRGAVRH